MLVQVVDVAKLFYIMICYKMLSSIFFKRFKEFKLTKNE